MAHSPSPASSPRLPSPPPIAEDQIGPTSPGVSLYEEQGGHFPGGGNNAVDHGAPRRIRPGTKAEDMAEGPPLVELSEIDSAFPLTEYLKALHYAHTHPASHPDTTAPITASVAQQLARPPPHTSQEIWLYELARLLIQKTNAIIVALFADSPPCSAQTCPEMRASEWQYLCAVHDPPKSCSAVDYCCHTLDWAATTLTSSKMFPSRLGLGGVGVGGGEKVLQLQMKEITNIFRRVYRIYAHAWFQHREMFWRVEGKTGLYVFFKTVCDEYGMILAENYTIPAEAEGKEPPPGTQQKKDGEAQASVVQQPVVSMLKREEGKGTDEEQQQQPVGNAVLAAGDTTKRHRHTLSDRASSVSTVIQEEAEEEEEEEGEEPRTAVQEKTEADLPAEEASSETPVDDTSSAQVLPDHDAKGEEKGHHDDEQDPMMGIARSDTLKPQPLKDEQQEEGGTTEADDAPSNETSETTSAVPAAATEDANVHERGEEIATIPQQHVMEPSEAPAADEAEAGKTVAD